jgi:hypothetical protein
VGWSVFVFCGPANVRPSETLPEPAVRKCPGLYENVVRVATNDDASACGCTFVYSVGRGDTSKRTIYLTIS